MKDDDIFNTVEEEDEELQPEDDDVEYGDDEDTDNTDAEDDKETPKGKASSNLEVTLQATLARVAQLEAALANKSETTKSNEPIPPSQWTFDFLPKNQDEAIEILENPEKFNARINEMMGSFKKTIETESLSGVMSKIKEDRNRETQLQTLQSDIWEKYNLKPNPKRQESVRELASYMYQVAPQKYKTMEELYEAATQKYFLSEGVKLKPKTTANKKQPNVARPDKNGQSKTRKVDSSIASALRFLKVR